MMTLKEILENAKMYDIKFHSKTNTSNGWKISIQGKSINDVLFLHDRLNSFLSENNIPYKIATAKRINFNHPEQSKKVMTIYCPNGTHINDLCESIYSLTMDYKGWYDIKTPTNYSHYAGGLFIRNDRDEYGNYIPANSTY